MFYVYLLKSKKDGDFYLGSTNDLKKRIREHNQGQVSSTKPRKPFILLYYEAYLNEEDARVREYNLKKRGQALAQLKRRMPRTLLQEIS